MIAVYRNGGYIASAYVVLGWLVGSAWLVGIGGGACVMWLLSQSAIKAYLSADGATPNGSTDGER